MSLRSLLKQAKSVIEECCDDGHLLLLADIEEALEPPLPAIGTRVITTDELPVAMMAMVPSGETGVVVQWGDQTKGIVVKFDRRIDVLDDRNTYFLNEEHCTKGETIEEFVADCFMILP